MKHARKLLSLCLTITVCFFCIAATPVARTRQTNPPAKRMTVTDNEPQILNSEAVYFPGAEGQQTAAWKSKALWVAAGAVVLVALVVGISTSSGGGGEEGGTGQTAPSSGTGEVSFGW